MSEKGDIIPTIIKRLLILAGFHKFSQKNMSPETNGSIAQQMSMRPAVMPDDEAFVKKLHATTLEDEVAMWGLPPEQSEMLVDMQYRAQHTQYQAQYENADYEIISFNGEPVGRLVSSRDETQVLGIDLAILPEFRSTGIGTVILENLIAEAKAGNKPFTLSVVKHNHRAIKLYQRVGAAITGESVSHYFMEWREDWPKDQQ